ncbi:MAG: PIN domain-containing protein [Thermoplasmatota archaeon]
MSDAGTDPEGRARHPRNFSGTVLLLDTNALMSPFQFNFNLDVKINEILPEAQAVVPTCVVRELKALAGKGSWKAKAALKLSEKYPLVIVKGIGDAPIFNLAVSKGWAVMTQDRGLRNQLLSRSVPVVFLRGLGRLEYQEP